jgi:hypothetical protein
MERTTTKYNPLFHRMKWNRSRGPQQSDLLGGKVFSRTVSREGINPCESLQALSGGGADLRCLVDQRAFFFCLRLKLKEKPTRRRTTALGDFE